MHSPPHNLLSRVDFSDTEFVMEELESKSERRGKIGKPSWVRRRLIWPLKAKVVRTLPFKVWTLTPSVFSLCLCEGVLDRGGCDPLLDGCRP